jgi:hypothetical protein
MIIYSKPKSRVVRGSGLFDWLGAVGSKVGNFVANNSGLIKNIANTVGDVTKAGATTASSIKQIVDLVKQSKANKAHLQPAQAAQAAQAATPIQVAPALTAALNQKSIDILNNLIPTASSAASSGVSGAGFKTISTKITPGRGLYLQR